MKTGYTYIMGSTTGTLYIGVTSNIYLRVRQHKNGTFEGFAKKYGCTRLLYYEEFADIRNAIDRETQLKGWRREKKLNLIRTKNADFRDLAEKWNWKRITMHERMNPELPVENVSASMAVTDPWGSSTPQFAKAANRSAQNDDD